MESTQQRKALEKAVEANQTWSLSKDKLLRKELQRLSEKILARAADVSQKCKTASESVDTKLIEVDLLINSFERISTVQFVENRVSEDEPSVDTPAEDGGKQQEAGGPTPGLFEKVQESLKIACSSFTEAEEEREREWGEEGKQVFVLPSIIGTEEYVTSKYCGLEALYGHGDQDEEGPSKFMQQSAAAGELDGVSVSSRAGSHYGSMVDEQDGTSEPSLDTAFSRKDSSQKGTSIPEAGNPLDFSQGLESSLVNRNPRRRTSSKLAAAKENKASNVASEPAMDQPSFLPLDADDALLSDVDALFGSEKAEDSKPKASYALSFDDIFGDDTGDKAGEVLAADSLFDTEPAAPREAMEMPPRQAGNLQASLAKILTESPSVGLFEEAGVAGEKPKKVGVSPAAEAVRGEATKQPKEWGGAEDAVVPLESTAQPHAVGGSTFAKDIAATKKGVSGDIIDSILSESPSVGLFEEDAVVNKVQEKQQEDSMQVQPPSALSESSIRASRASLDKVLNTSEPLEKRVKVPVGGVRDPFAMAMALKKQNEPDESDGSFSSDDDFDSESESEAPPKPEAKAEPTPFTSPVLAGETKKGDVPVAQEEVRAEKAAEENPFMFTTKVSGDTPSETPQKLPQEQPKPKPAPARKESDNPFATGASDLFGDKEKGESSFDSLFGESKPASRPQSSNLFDEPFSGPAPSKSQQAPAQKSPFGGSDLFSSSSDLFSTTEKERRVSKGLFDDFLDDDKGKSGGGLFD